MNQPETLKFMAASRLNEKLIQLRTETDRFVIECWSQDKTPQGWSQLKDAYGNRIKLELFNTQRNKHLKLTSPLDTRQGAKMVMINDFCKIMLANENPRYSLLDNKRIMIQQYWDHSKEIDDAFKRALKINKEYEKMVQHLVDQIKKNQEDATKNEIPEILMWFSPIHILRCRQAHQN